MIRYMMPPGLEYDAASRRIHGTPTEAGVYEFQLPDLPHQGVLKIEIVPCAVPKKAPIEKLRAVLAELVELRDSADRGEHQFGESSPWNERIAAAWQAARDALVK